MTLIEGLVALGVVGAIGFIVYAKVAQGNPKISEKVKEFFPKKDPGNIRIRGTKEKISQLYEDRRSMM